MVDEGSCVVTPVCGVQCTGVPGGYQPEHAALSRGPGEHLLCPVAAPSSPSPRGSRARQVGPTWGCSAALALKAER